MEVLYEVAHKIGFDWRLAITHFINFALIFVLLVKFALPGLRKTIEIRNKKIQEGLSLREDAKKLVQDAENESLEIRKQAAKDSESIISKGEKSAKDIVTNANEQASNTIRNANKEKEEAKDLGLKQAEELINKDIGSILAKISEKAFGENLTKENNSMFVRQTFKETYDK